jgi:hypothetical protein
MKSPLDLSAAAMIVPVTKISAAAPSLLQTLLLLLSYLGIVYTERALSLSAAAALQMALRIA